MLKQNKDDLKVLFTAAQANPWTDEEAEVMCGEPFAYYDWSNRLFRKNNSYRGYFLIQKERAHKNVTIADDGCEFNLAIHSWHCNV